MAAVGVLNLWSMLALQPVEDLLDDVRAGVRRHDDGYPELTQVQLCDLVAMRIDPDHDHPGLPQMLERRAVESAKVSPDHRHLSKAGPGDRQKIREVGASTRDLGVRDSLEGGDQRALPAVADRRD